MVESNSNASLNQLEDENEMTTEHRGNEETESEEEGDNNDDITENYKEKYRVLKRKLKCLLYEQECFHEELRKYQRKCLRVNRDKSFLLDRLLQYEQPTLSSDDENTTDTSEDEEREQLKRMVGSKHFYLNKMYFAQHNRSYFIISLIIKV